MNPNLEFQNEVKESIARQGEDGKIKAATKEWLERSVENRYCFNFTWMGRPIIQYPQDIVATQEIIFRVKPDLIVETGIAHGGSLIFSASMLELLGGDGQVLGIDIDIRKHNREEIEKHPMSKRIHMLQGSSISPEIIEQVKEFAEGSKVLVMLDSNHTYEHVKAELALYSPLVKKGSYLIVYDTAIDDLVITDRPWGLGNGPKKAVHEFLRENKRFEIDKSIDNKILISAAPDGYLRCVAD
jgi:cephalosporin hydroxylase